LKYLSFWLIYADFSWDIICWVIEFQFKLHGKLSPSMELSPCSAHDSSDHNPMTKGFSNDSSSVTVTSNRTSLSPGAAAGDRTRSSGGEKFPASKVTSTGSNNNNNTSSCVESGRQLSSNNNNKERCQPSTRPPPGKDATKNATFDDSAIVSLWFHIFLLYEEFLYFKIIFKCKIWFWSWIIF